MRRGQKTDKDGCTVEEGSGENKNMRYRALRSETAAYVRNSTHFTRFPRLLSRPYFEGCNIGAKIKQGRQMYQSIEKFRYWNFKRIPIFIFHNIDSTAYIPTPRTNPPTNPSVSKMVLHFNTTLSIVSNFEILHRDNAIFWPSQVCQCRWTKHQKQHSAWCSNNTDHNLKHCHRAAATPLWHSVNKESTLQVVGLFDLVWFDCAGVLNKLVTPYLLYTEADYLIIVF